MSVSSFSFGTGAQIWEHPLGAYENGIYICKFANMNFTDVKFTLVKHNTMFVWMHQYYYYYFFEWLLY